MEPRTVKLTSVQKGILACLANCTDWTSRDQIKELIGRKKGYSKALGAPTNPPLRPESLEGRGFVERRDDRTPFVYRITRKGRDAIGREGKMVQDMQVSWHSLSA